MFSFGINNLVRPAVYAGVLLALTTDVVTNGIEFAIGWIAPDTIKRKVSTDADTWAIKVAKVAIAVASLSLVDTYVFDKQQPANDEIEE